ncbi:hypothetical protein [Hyalangium rubrum]|uniref:Lipoprotein n=1 Tax=Hyalangium rubrum TaxID=3103134 RepID=A0ABU5HI62_9BACT|nr:hypothetical protein [Hyalangium sp. s54d21]MDY7232497.1 hypothetical protein [Hyalangium sp. s54d21]
MLSRALVPIVLCAAATWPLRALACINAMDTSAFAFTQTLWLDLLLWTAGAVFLNRVVLVNVRGSTAEGQPSPSGFRRFFFLLVGAALILLLAAVSAAGPLLSLSARDLARCTVNRSMVLVLLAAPTVLFLLQAVIFQGWGKRLFGEKRSVALLSLVSTSVLWVMAVGLARDEVVLPKLCKPTKGFIAYDRYGSGVPK